MNRKINMRPIVLGIMMIVLLLVFIPTIARASSDIEVILNDEVDPKLEEIAVKYHHQTIQAWHHSGKYWSNETLGITVQDSELGGDLRFLKEFIVPDEGYPFEFSLPYEVIQALNGGKRVVVKVESGHKWINLGQFMNDIDQPEKYPVTISGNKMRIIMHPYFNYETESMGRLLTYEDRGIFTSIQMPFVRQMYGMNVYSVYGNGIAAGQAGANFTDATNAGGHLTYDMINPDGTLKPGYQVKILGTSKVVPSAGLRIGQSEGVFKATGGFGLSFHYPLNFRFFIEGEGKSDIVMRELDLIDEDGKVVESFRRNIDPADPFNQSKQTLVRTSTSPVGASTLDPEKTYKLRAKYQFISFAEGVFDIDDPSSMTPEQRAVTTEVNKNIIDVKYAYDTNARIQGVFDSVGQETSIDKPNTALRNMEMATFEWDYQIPDDKREVRIAVDVPKTAIPLNENTGNDWADVFGTKFSVNIGMMEPVRLYRGSSEVKFIDPEEDNHAVRFRVGHFFGDEAVGLDPATNPKVRLTVTVVDANNSEILRETVQATSNLNPGGYVDMPIVDDIDAESGMIKVCGEIHPIHASLGFNSDPTDDKICAPFMVSKNYAVKDVKATPQMLYLGEGESKIYTPVSLDFTLVNESKDETDKLPSNPLVVIKRDSTTVWSGQLSADPGSATRHTVNLPPRNYYQGNSTFSVEVNADRNIQEFKPGVSNPYLDNRETASLTVKRYQECIDCDYGKMNNDNTWTEEFDFRERLGNVRSATATDRECIEEDEDGKCIKKDSEKYTYYYCDRTSDRSWSERKDYWETYAIEHVYFKSKWSEDNYGGWIDLMNMTGKIKAGYGFELRVVTKYETNRNQMPAPEPYRRDPIPRVSKPFGGSRGGGYCDTLTRSPGVSPVNSPSNIYLEMPYTDSSATNVCYILSGSSSGSWYNNTKTFQLPLRSDFGSGSSRKIYINEDARPNTTHILSITTPIWDGYQPNNPVGSLANKDELHDCVDVRIQILPQNDIKDHIVQ